MRLRQLAGIVTAAVLVVAAPIGAQQGATPGGRVAQEQKREAWQKVEEVFAAMGVRAGATVADLGAGDGFFTVRLARAVGAGGKVYAVDVAAEPLRKLRARAAEEGLSNIEVVEGAVDDPKLPAGALDAVLIVNAYHEMTSYRAILAGLKKALKPEGRLVIIEPIAESRRDRPRDEQTRNHEIAVDFVKQDLREAGFKQVALQDPFTRRDHGHEHGDEMWLLVATPQSASAAAWSAAKAMDWQSPALRISAEEFKRLKPDEVLVLDVRDSEMFRAGHLPGAELIVPEQILSPAVVARLRSETRPIVTYCS